MDVIVHRIERVIDDPPIPLAPCAGSRVDTRRSIYWEILTPGGSTSFTLPTLPGGFPRQSADGLIIPAVTPEDDSLSWTAAFIGLGGTGLPSAPAFDFNRFEIDELTLHVTHIASNGSDLQP